MQAAPHIQGGDGGIGSSQPFCKLPASLLLCIRKHCQRVSLSRLATQHIGAEWHKDSTCTQRRHSHGSACSLEARGTCKGADYTRVRTSPPTKKTSGMAVTLITSAPCAFISSPCVWCSHFLVAAAARSASSFARTSACRTSACSALRLHTSRGAIGGDTAHAREQVVLMLKVTCNAVCLSDKLNTSTRENKVAGQKQSNTRQEATVLLSACTTGTSA